MNCTAYDYDAHWPNCKECPRYLDDCDGDPEVLEKEVM